MLIGNYVQLTNIVDCATSTGSANSPWSGSWYDPTHNGEGIILQVLEDGSSLAAYTDDDVRISLSWKARVYPSHDAKDAATAGQGALADDTVLARFEEALGEPLAAADLTSPALRDQLQARFPGYAAG